MRHIKTVVVVPVLFLAFFLALVFNPSPIVWAQKTGTGSTAKAVSKEKPLYLRWMNEAQKGDSEKEYNVGVAFYHGIAGAKHNYKKAFRWFSKAANHGSSQACVKLGDMYFYGCSVRKSSAKAMRWYRKAAGGGNSGGQEKLGDMYYHGKGVRRNYTEAEKWYRKAAEKELAPDPCAKLARLYFLGRGVKENDAEALKWFLKAYELGGVDIVHYIAGICERRKNYAEAEKWLIKGATRGGIIAMQSLAEMYTKGKGIPKNHVEACKWLLVLAQKDYQPRFEKFLRQVRRKMTKAQISKARKLAAPLIKKLVTDGDRQWVKYAKENLEFR